jgi:hypothetical protein
MKTVLHFHENYCVYIYYLVYFDKKEYDNAL